MIDISYVRLINWYGFTDSMAPFGHFTLIAGKNGNGKSAMLDAVKYALFGDTVFNKSTENKGSRTISSYTRGLLDATERTYMRPADLYPTVYTHISIEFHEEEMDRYFILGAVIETNSANGCTTQRYCIEGKRLSEIEYTYVEDDEEYIYSSSELQKLYNLKMYAAVQGVEMFMQRTGLRLNEEQTAALRRKLRSMMSYDPDAKIDTFIRDSVLEKKTIDLRKLIDTKDNIDKLTNAFEIIDNEIKELDNIIRCFEDLKKAREIVLVDDIKRAYRDLLSTIEEISKAKHNMEIADREIFSDTQKFKELETLEEEKKTALSKAKYNLEQLDCAKAIKEAEDELSKAVALLEDKAKEKKKLEEMQERISDLVKWMNKENVNIPERDILLSLLSSENTKAKKAKAVEDFKAILDTYKNDIIGKIAIKQNLIDSNERDQAKYRELVEEYAAKKTTYSEIPDYVALKNKINKALKERGIASEAHFACEYVISITDETWRDVIEGYLGRRRYTVLVEPEYYDIADEVFNSMRSSDAHLFNTRLLCQEEIVPEEDSVSKFLEVRNPVAKKYFDFQLGRFHAVPIDKVREYHNAMCKEGRVSVAMDSFFIKSDRIKYYYLGQETLEINRKKADEQLKRLQEKYYELHTDEENYKTKKSYLINAIECFVECNYEAYQEYNEALNNQNNLHEKLQQLIEAQRDNMEFIHLSELVSVISKELTEIEEKKDSTNERINSNKISYAINDEHFKTAKSNKSLYENALCEFEQKNKVAYLKAIEEYKRFISSGRTGSGDVQKDIGRAKRSVAEKEKSLNGAQCAYNATRALENHLPVSEDSLEKYNERRNKIWMDDRQDIQYKLQEQKRQYLTIFKNEFVLTILKYCEAAKNELNLINAELKVLSFKSVYEFDVNYIKDGSDYEKILEYARYLKEKENLGIPEWQTTMASMTSFSDEQGDELEKKLRSIIDKIVTNNDKEKIDSYADYRNYMTYEIRITNDVLKRAKLSKQSGYNSGAEVQIPYMLILISALLMIYNDKSRSIRIVFIDEPFAKMDPSNVKIMLGYMKKQNLQMVFCAPDKTELIGNECNVILPVLRTKPDLMEIGRVEFHEG